MADHGAWPTSASHYRAIRAYYQAHHAIFGYQILKGVNHFGYHPNPARPLTLEGAQVEQNYLIGRLLGGRPGLEVLDCGCGDGASANYIAHKFGHRVTGVDIVANNIRRARKQSRLDNNDNVFLESNYSSLPLHDDAFDAAYAMEALVHAPNPEHLFAGLSRVLKPGGKLIFCEYMLMEGGSRHRTARQTLAALNQACPMPALAHFTPAKLSRMLARTGFTAISITDITRHVLPSVEQLRNNIVQPIGVIEQLNLGQQFARLQRDYHLYSAFLGEDRVLQYSLVTARKTPAYPVQSSITPVASLHKTPHRLREP